MVDSILLCASSRSSSIRCLQQRRNVITLARPGSRPGSHARERDRRLRREAHSTESLRGSECEVFEEETVCPYISCRVLLTFFEAFCRGLYQSELQFTMEAAGWRRAFKIDELRKVTS